MANKIPLVILVGATAVGKTNLALECAQKLNAEIISADSRLFYRGMDIGTAKPTLNELELVPHHLIDIASPDEIISMGTFRKLAEQCIADIHTRGKLPLLVGGTGQYIRAVIEGWTVPEVFPDPMLRINLEKMLKESGISKLGDWLKVLDNDYYVKVDKQNHRRLIRALEVILTTGVPLSKQRNKLPCPYNYLMVGLRRPRPELYQRIDERINQMVADGLVDEVHKLIELGYGTSLPSMSAIGYAEIRRYICNETSLDEAVKIMKQRTHLFVRRQANWFKENDNNIHWINANDNAKMELIDLVYNHFNLGVGHGF